MTPDETVTALVAACEARDLDAVCALVTMIRRAKTSALRSLSRNAPATSGASPLSSASG